MPITMIHNRPAITVRRARSASGRDEDSATAPIIATESSVVARPCSCLCRAREIDQPRVCNRRRKRHRRRRHDQPAQRANLQQCGAFITNGLPSSASSATFEAIAAATDVVAPAAPGSRSHRSRRNREHDDDRGKSRDQADAEAGHPAEQEAEVEDRHRLAFVGPS